MPAALDLYLASTSPRRHALLAAAGVRFEPCAPGPEYEGDAGDHDTEPGDPRALAVARARRKACGAAVLDPAVPILGVDTVVDLDGVELGKAKDRAAATAMLSRLAGRRHLVHTAHCLVLPRTGARFERLTTAAVDCARPAPAALERYLASEQWRGKAGAYGIQDPDQDFLQLADGDFDTVVGLSVTAVRELLHALAEEA